MGIIDIIILLLFLLFMIFGFFRGFIKQVFSSMAWLIAIIGATFLCSTVAGMLSSSSIGGTLNTTIYDWIASKGEIFTTNIPTITEEYMGEMLTQIGVPSILHSFLIGLIDVSNFADTSIAEFISPQITNLLLTIGAYIIIYLVIFIIVKIIAKLFGNIVRGSALGMVDGVLGAIWGAVKVCIFVSIIMLGLSLVVTMPFGDSVNEWITTDMRLNSEEFGIAKFFYENNLILFVISKISFK